MTQLAAGHLKIQQDTIPELNPSYRLLLGPGPCNVDPRVLRITLAPQLGHLDPEFFAILEDTAHLLRWMFQTKNEMTLCVSGSGFSGAEAVLCNLLEEGDTIISGSLGFFSGQIVEISQRAGANVVNLETELGAPLEADVLEEAFKDDPDAKIFATAIAETSTGLLQSLAELEHVTHAHGALFVVDAVCGLGGVPMNVDEMKIDACYALSVLTAVSLPEGVDELAIRNGLLDEYNIEIGGGFGPLKGRLIRIGLMGYNSCRKNVDTVLAALEHILPRSGLTPQAGAALAAADAVYTR